jgi:hypothetical protein
MLHAARFAILFLLFYPAAAAPHSQSKSQSPVLGQAPAHDEQKNAVKFTGEVERGKMFERDIGHGLLFWITPDPGGLDMGWTIEIVPKSHASDDEDEFSAIATPPYHFFNLRYLDTSYGTTAKESVGISPRKFNFVQSVEDARAAYDIVNAEIYPSDISKPESERLARRAATIRLGTGELAILDSRITPGKKEGDMGTIDWLKFEVELRFSTVLTLAEVLDLKPSP